MTGHRRGSRVDERSPPVAVHPIDTFASRGQDQLVSAAQLLEFFCGPLTLCQCLFQLRRPLADALLEASIQRADLLLGLLARGDVAQEGRELTYPAVE